ncbi:MAG TPA: MFS transporter [Bryobacteraceae bacterium]
MRPTRWLMISFAFAATLINYLDRQALSVAAPVLIDRFHMSNGAYGWVVSAFMLAYTISNGISGPLIDRLGTRLGYALCIAWWSAASVLHALTQGPLTLGVFRFLLGIGEAGNWPAAIKVVAEWFPESERAFGCGLFNSGSSFGAILAPPIVAYIVLNWGWQYAFLLIGLLGFVWLGLWWPTYRKPERPPDGLAVESSPPSAWRLVRHRFVWTFIVAKIFFDPAWYFYIFWFPTYLKSARHFDMAAIGKYAWLPFFVAGLGNLFGGALSGFLIRRGVSVTVARKSAMTVFVLLMMSAIPAVLAPTAAMSILFVSLAMTGYTGALANMLAMPADVFPGNAVGSIWGLASMGAGFGGMLFAAITGWVVDHYSYTPVFIGFGLMPLICAGIVWGLTGPLRPAEARSYS